MTNPRQSRSATLENVFVGEGYFDLRLRIAELIILQEKTGVGPYVLANRILHGEWHVTDIIETIRLALIGGGLDNRAAFDLVTRNITEGNIFPYASTAGEIVLAAIMGVDDEQPEDEDAEDDEDPFATTPTD